MKTSKFKKTLASLTLSISKQYNAHEDAKSSIAFMNNSEEYHAKPDSPPETEYVIMLPNNIDLEQLQEFAKLPNLTKLHSTALATALSSTTDYSDAVDVKSMAEAVKTPYEKEWTAARDAELSSMKSNGVMVPVTYEAWMAPLVDSKLVFKVKRHPDNTLDKFKVRWVARGFSEIFGRHYNETYSPVASLNLLRLLLSIFANRTDVTVYQADVKTAFLHPRLKEQIFMKPMKFMGLANGQVFKLLKTIYGLKQSSMEWYKDIKATILSMGYVQSQFDACLFIKGDPSDGTFAIIIVYVDDVLCFTNSKELWDIAHDLMHAKYGLDDRGTLHFYRGLEFTQDTAEGSWSICNEKYIDEIVDAAGYSQAKACLSPEDGSLITKEDQASDDYIVNGKPAGFPNYRAFLDHFRKILGMCMYASTCWRGDITHALKNPSKAGGRPGPVHLAALNKIVRYLKGTTSLSLKLIGPKGPPVLQLFSDADDANNEDNRRSISSVYATITDSRRLRFAFFLWMNPSQTKTARSSTESEIIAIDSAHRAGLHERSLLYELGYPQPATVIAIDNTASITIMNGDHPGKYSGVKHIARRFFACQEERLNGNFTLQHIPGEINPADLGCAYKSPRHHIYLRDTMMGQESPDLTSTAMAAFIDDGHSN
jgi:hypothetical protein